MGDPGVKGRGVAKGGGGVTLARADKTLEEMRANPRDRRIASLEAVAASFGVNRRKPGGSHVIFEHQAVAEALSVPARRAIKPIQVRRFVRLIDIVRGEDGRTRIPFHDPSDDGGRRRRLPD